MSHRMIRAGFVAIATVAGSTIIAVAEDDLWPDPPIFDATVTCHVSFDPGFIATIEDRSNDRAFFTTIEDISNDSGFLYPVPMEPLTPDAESTPCPSIQPSPTPALEP